MQVSGLEVLPGAGLTDSGNRQYLTTSENIIFSCKIFLCVAYGKFYF